MKTRLVESIPLKEQHHSKPAGGRLPEYREVDGLCRNDEIIRLSERKIRKKGLGTSKTNRSLKVDPLYKGICFKDIVGRHPSIVDLIDFGEKIAHTNMIVSLRGATGTGKDLFARAIHSASDRKGPFVPISCANLPKHLLESELFGYVGGTFTGCRKEGKPGLFEIAQNGTVFLDEIAEMPLSFQAKILRLIQEKSVRRIGGSKEIPINSRIITATNRNLEQMVGEKQFRQDLYYRINVLPIHIPPLNERVEDIPLLANHYLHRINKKMGLGVLCITPEAMNKLRGHDWPGNVRELKNVIKRAVVLTNGETIKMNDILFSHEICLNNQFNDKQYQDTKNASLSLKAMVAAYEKELILRSLKKFNSIRKAARHLQLSHTALQNKVKKYGLS